MNGSPEVRGNRIGSEEVLEPSDSVKPVRCEQAGILGRLTCKFDRQTNEYLSTTRPVVVTCGILELGGLIPGVIEDVAVSCPRFRKCDSCPNREK